MGSCGGGGGENKLIVRYSCVAVYIIVSCVARSSSPLPGKSNSVSVAQRWQIVFNRLKKLFIDHVYTFVEYIYIPLNRHPPASPHDGPCGGIAAVMGAVRAYKLYKFGIKTWRIYRPTRINDTRARPYVVPEKNTPRKTVTFFSLYFYFFDITRHEGFRRWWQWVGVGAHGATRGTNGTMPTSFIKRRPRSIWRQIDCNTAVSPKCIRYTSIYNARKRSFEGTNKVLIKRIWVLFCWKKNTCMYVYTLNPIPYVIRFYS